MDVGVQLVFASYGWDNISDTQVWDEEIRLARLADELGYDAIWSVEPGPPLPRWRQVIAL